MRPLIALLAGALLIDGATAASLSAASAQEGVEADSVVPVSRVPPNYPRRAVQRRIEASCTVAFDIDPEGVPTNICVACAASDLTEAFEREVTRAFARWRYQPLAAAPDEQRTDVTAVLEFGLTPVFSGPEAPPRPICDGNPLS